MASRIHVYLSQSDVCSAVVFFCSLFHCFFVLWQSSRWFAGKEIRYVESLVALLWLYTCLKRPHKNRQNKDNNDFIIIIIFFSLPKYYKK